MSLRSMLFQGDSVRVMILLAAIAAGLVASAPLRVRADNPLPSPFAGHYGCGLVAANLTTSDSGRITGYWGLSSLSGRIADDGFITLTVKTVYLSIGGEATRGHKSSSSTHNGVGLATSDEEGNLYWVLEWDDGSVTEFFWPRCG